MHEVVHGRAGKTHVTAPLHWLSQLNAWCRHPGCRSMHSRQGRRHSWPARCQGAVGSGSWQTTCPCRWTPHGAAVTLLSLTLSCLLASLHHLLTGTCPHAADACLKLLRVPQGGYHFLTALLKFVSLNPTSFYVSGSI